MTTQEIKLVLDAKMHELTSSQIGREEIAIEKNAEEMDEIQRGGDRVLALESLTRKWQTRSLILEALKRIENNSYGICAECEEDISAKRLNALPWAKYCIRCQELMDSTNSDMRWDTAA
jgi:DnaK suppressor protein